MKLKKILIGALIPIVCSITIHAGATGKHNGAAKNWTYYGSAGPDNWSKLDSKFFMCQGGSNQSPIDLVSSAMVTATSGIDPIKFNYVTGATSIVNNGHTIQVNVKEGSSIKIDSIVFDLKQFHFHTPSENMIEGNHFPLEAHFVHVAKDGELAVVAVMFEYGADNRDLKRIWSKMPQTKNEAKATCSLPSNMIEEILPDHDRSYYRFDGSLTTPPCSEGVRWFVMQKYSHVSKSQVEKFEDLMHGHDNRPIQPLKARKILKSVSKK
jgi:carbonic anhydrase